MAEWIRTSAAAERCEFGSWGLDRCPRSGTTIATHPNPVIGKLLVCAQHSDELHRMRMDAMRQTMRQVE